MTAMLKRLAYLSLGLLTTGLIVLGSVKLAALIGLPDEAGLVLAGFICAAWFVIPESWGGEE
ncbi:MAG: hypothetical protein AAF416_15575 [Pseudomonadota bacterium]